MPEQQHLARGLGEVGQIRIAQHRVDFLLPLLGFRAQRTPLVDQRGVQIDITADRLPDQFVQLLPFPQVGRPMQEPALLEILQLLGGHQGKGESPNVLSHIHPCINGLGGMLGMAENSQSRTMGFFSSPPEDLAVVVSVLGKPGDIRFIGQIFAHPIPDLFSGHTRGQPGIASRVKHPGGAETGL